MNESYKLDGDVEVSGFNDDTILISSETEGDAIVEAIEPEPADIGGESSCLLLASLLEALWSE